MCQRQTSIFVQSSSLSNLQSLPAATSSNLQSLPAATSSPPTPVEARLLAALADVYMSRRRLPVDRTLHLWLSPVGAGLHLVRIWATVAPLASLRAVSTQRSIRTVTHCRE